MSGNTALVIIDVQMGMFDEDEPVPNGEQLLQALSDLIDKARRAEVPVVYIQHNDSQFVKGNSAWPIHPSIAPLEGELVVQKTTPDSFNKTNLREA